MADVVADTELRIGGEAARLARLLSQSLGRPLEDSVIEALREAVAWQRSKDERVADMLRIAEAVRSHITDPAASSDHSWLYDENGLPV